MYMKINRQDKQAKKKSNGKNQQKLKKGQQKTINK